MTPPANERKSRLLGAGEIDVSFEFFPPKTDAMEDTLWRSIRRDITAFLTRVWRDGALFGAKPEDAFYVRIDEALNPFNPFLTIYAATTRRTEQGEVIGAVETVSREEALRMMTSAAARFSFDESSRGSIERGKLADFVVLDTDIMTCPADKLPSIRPDLTVVGGRIAFDRKERGAVR